MNLCIDCGNTLIKCGLFENDNLVFKFSLDSKTKRSSSEYKMIYLSFLANYKEINGIIISSVVPLLVNPISLALKEIYDIEPILISRAIKTGLNIKIDYPNELGNDLLCGAIGAISKFDYPLVVADLGTATKMYVVDKNKNFIGGIISSGVEISMKTLNDSTSLLLEVPLSVPKKIIGKNTKESIQSGIILGQACMIESFANKMEQELGYKLNRVLTGGFASIIRNELNNFNYDEYLVLEGLNQIYRLNGGK